LERSDGCWRSAARVVDWLFDVAFVVAAAADVDGVGEGIGDGAEGDGTRDGTRVGGAGEWVTLGVWYTIIGIILGRYFTLPQFAPMLAASDRR
jgi:hypothetical protein